MSLTRLITTGILALTLLAGCGKKGPLYHPGKDQASESPTAQDPSPARTDEISDD